MEHHTEPSKLPNWLMLLIFLIIMAVLFFLGDTFTFILGLLVMSIIFAGGYDRNPANHGHH